MRSLLIGLSEAVAYLTCLAIAVGAPVAAHSAKGIEGALAGAALGTLPALVLAGIAAMVYESRRQARDANRDLERMARDVAALRALLESAVAPPGAAPGPVLRAERPR